MKIMALDVGDSKIGIAVADCEVRIAVPMQVIDKRAGDVFDAICNIIKSQSIKTLIVGFPKKLDGEIGEQAEKVISFVEELKQKISVEVILWDERLTTVEAHKRLKGLYRRSKIRQIIDASAAMLILQSYLDCEQKRD